MIDASSPLLPVGLIEFFTYPRLLVGGGAIIGYDFGFFMTNRYMVLGNAKTREQAEALIMEWIESRKPDYPISIFHETEPSLSKHLKARQ